MKPTVLLSVLVVCLLCSLPSTLSQGTRNTYDFIIVGAGSAGSTVTGELAVKCPSCSFLIIEAGGDATDPMVHNTLLQGDLLNSTFTYLRDDQLTDPAPDYFNYTILVNRGKMTAGSMGVNAMFYVIGDPFEWDSTASDIGDPAWSWAATNKYRNRVTQDYSIYEFNSKQLGGKQYIRAFNNAGWTYDTDSSNGINGITNSFQVARLNPNKPGGIRETAFERKILSQNLANVELLTFHRVSKVLVDSNKKAYGVQVVNLRSNNTYQFTVNKEVILSGGAFRTPQILQLSGIGPAPLLQKLGIPVVLNAPAVGANLNDHIGLHAYWISLLPSEIPILYALPNFQFFGPSPPGQGPQFQMEISSGFTSVLPLRMFLNGSAHINTTDPTANPVITYPITTAYEDACVYGAQNILFPVINQLRAQNVTGAGVTPVVPGASDDDIRQWLRETMVTNFHPTGTARVSSASDNTGVVDSRFRVKGIQNLRVVDASVHRHLPSGNINAPTLLLGYFAADLIAQDNHLSSGQGHKKRN